MVLLSFNDVERRALIEHYLDGASDAVITAKYRLAANDFQLLRREARRKFEEHQAEARLEDRMRLSDGRLRLCS